MESLFSEAKEFSQNNELLQDKLDDYVRSSVSHEALFQRLQTSKDTLRQEINECVQKIKSEAQEIEETLTHFLATIRQNPEPINRNEDEEEKDDILFYMRNEMDEDVMEREDDGGNRFVTDKMFKENRQKPEYFSRFHRIWTEQEIGILAEKIGTAVAQCQFNELSIQQIDKISAFTRQIVDQECLNPKQMDTETQVNFFEQQLPLGENYEFLPSILEQCIQQVKNLQTSIDHMSQKFDAKLELVEN